MSCRKCYVSGRVQGVFYRETTRNMAQSMNITGRAVNLTDGRVEVLICGTEQQLNALTAWLWQGSTWSDVTDVSCHDTEPHTPDGFTTG